MSRSGGLERAPLWLRWVLSVAVAVAILVAIVLFVSNNNTDGPATQNPTAVARADREGDVVVEQDQAPHVARLTAAITPVKAIERAVRQDIAAQVGQGFLNGPVERSTCIAMTAHGGRLPFSCNVIAAHVTYPFQGVVDVRSKQIVYCKRDLPPVPSQNIPVSRRCR